MPDKCTDNPRDCPLIPRVEALEEANKQHSRTHEGMFDRIRALETENAVQNAHWKNVDSKLDELTAMVRDLTGKAGKRWESCGLGQRDLRQWEVRGGGEFHQPKGSLQLHRKRSTHIKSRP